MKLQTFRITPSKANLQESPVMGGYLNVEVRIFQIQREEPIPLAHLLEDLFQSSYPGCLFHRGVVQLSEIEDGPEPESLWVGGIIFSAPFLGKFITSEWRT